MNSEDFKKLVTRFVKNYLPGRKLFIWVGKKETLICFLPPEIIKEIDLFKLISSEGASEYGAEKTIRSVLLQVAKNVSPLAKSKQILVLTNAYILARYKIPLTPFYDYYLGDQTIVVLQIPKFSFLNELPSYINYDSSLVINYFKKILPEEHKGNIILEE